MDFSLDDYIRQKGINAPNTGVRSRLGFQQGPSAIKRNAGATRPPLANRLGQVRIGPFDARQKLSLRSSTSVVSQSPDGFIASSTISESNLPVAHVQPTRLHNVPNHGMLQRTKYADARQRLEMKRRQQVTGGDARMQLLAKRRFRMAEESTGGDNPEATFMSRSQVPHVAAHQSTKADSSHPMRVTMSVPNKISRTDAPAVMLPGKSINRSIRTGVGAKVQPTALSRPALVAGSNYKRTFSNKSLQRSSVVEFDFEEADEYAMSSSQYKVSIVNDQYEEPRPIETIVSGRSITGQIKTVSSAAKVAAAAVAASRTEARPGLRTATKTAVAQNKSVLRAAEPVIVRSPIQGYRITVSNLHPSVTIDDLLELYSDVGPLKNVRMSRPTIADIVFVNVEDAVAAMKMYDSRELDGLPMSVKLMFQPPSQIGPKKLEPTVNLDIAMLQRALFKTAVVGSKPSIPVNFTVQL